MQIPVYDKKHRRISVETFKPNLNIHGPAYLNEGGNMGLCRVSSGKYTGCLAVLYQSDVHPSSSYGEILSDNEGWELCRSRGKVHLIDQLRIEFNVGILGVDDDEDEDV